MLKVDHFVNLSRDVVNLGVFDKILIESLEYLPLRHGHHHEVIGVDFSADIDFIMSLNFSNKCLETLKQKNIDGEMIRNWVKKTTDDYFNHKSNKDYALMSSVENKLFQIVKGKIDNKKI